MTLRVGCVSYMNAYPLMHALRPEPYLAPPSELYRALLAGHCDVALLPSVLLAKHPDWQRVSTTCIASEGEVMSVRVFHRRPLNECRTIALDQDSLTSVVLFKIILEKVYQRVLKDILFTHSADPVRDFQDSTVDAVLAIGDKALLVPETRDAFNVLDLGSTWTAWTGLPFVYAVWMAPALSDQSCEDIAHFSRALDEGLLYAEQTRAEWILSLSKTSGVSREVLTRYFTAALQYRLTPSHEAGLSRFLQESRKYDLTET